MPNEQERMPLAPGQDLPHTQDPDAPLRMEMELGQLKASHGQLQDKYNNLVNERERLQEALADKTRELMELQQAHGVVVRAPYEYKEGECRPVPPNGVCEVCGWEYNTQRRPGDKQREPHPIQP